VPTTQYGIGYLILLGGRNTADRFHSMVDSWGGIGIPDSLRKMHTKLVVLVLLPQTSPTSMT